MVTTLRSSVLHALAQNTNQTKTLGDLLKEEKIAQGAVNTYLAVRISGKLIKGVLAVASYFRIGESKRVLSKLRVLMYLLEAASSGYQSTVAMVPAGLSQRAWIF